MKSLRASERARESFFSAIHWWNWIGCRRPGTNDENFSANSTNINVYLSSEFVSNNQSASSSSHENDSGSGNGKRNRSMSKTIKLKVWMTFKVYARFKCHRLFALYWFVDSLFGIQLCREINRYFFCKHFATMTEVERRKREREGGW